MPRRPYRGRASALPRTAPACTRPHARTPPPPTCLSAGTCTFIPCLFRLPEQKGRPAAMQWIGRTCPPGAAHLVVAVRATSAKGWLCGRQSDQEVDSAEQWAFTPRWTPTAAATPSTTAGTAHGHRITPPPTTGTGSRGTKLTWPAGPTSTMSRCSRQWASLQNKSASDGDTSTTGVRADHVRPGKARGLVRSRAARRRPEARVRAPGRRRCCRTIQLVSAALFEMHDEWSASPRPRRRYGGHLP